MKPLQELLIKKPKKLSVSIIAVFFFLISFFPFSHAHAFEEGHIAKGSKAKAHGHHEHHGHHDHHDHNDHYDYDERVAANSHSCCEQSSGLPSHHHFLNELFHYSLEKKRFFSTDFFPIHFLTFLFPSKPIIQSIEFFAFCWHVQAFDWITCHYSQLVSGISPPFSC